MMIRHYLVLAALCMACCTLGSAQPSASWEGLVGLYTQPTAETLHPGEIALTYSEIRFSELNEPRESRDSWFSASATATLTRHWEVGLTLRNETLKSFETNDLSPTLSVQQAHVIGDVKYIVTPPQGKRIGLALGVQDITNATNEIRGVATDRGRRFFLVGSYQWAHLGLTDDKGGLGAFAGAEWPLTDNVDLIAEYITRPTFILLKPTSSKVNFNLGARITPRSVPNLRIDLAAIGDSRFDFGFSFSYRFKP